MATIAEWLAQETLPTSPEYDYWRAALPKRLVILPENDFRDFGQFSTEVIKPKPKPGKPPHSVAEDSSVYPLPKDTREILQAQAEQGLNAGLQMERYLLCNSQSWELTQEAKRRRNALLSFNKGNLSCLINAHRQRWEALLKGWEARG